MGYYSNSNKYQRKNEDSGGTPKFLDASIPKFQGKFQGALKPLMSEAEKAAERVPIDELAFDFSCRVTRMYKWLNEGKLSKADRDIVGAYGLQMLRSASSVSANLNEAKHPQSDADYLSKATIALKEARETEHWLRLLNANGYVNDEQFTSLNNDLDRILRILVSVTTKVRERLKNEKK